MTTASLRSAVANGFGLRLRPWPLKLAYVVVVYLGVPFGVVHALLAVGAVGVGTTIAGQVVTLAAMLFAARIFRGRYEDVRPPRPWWQMTARAKLSRRLGTLTAIGTVLEVVALVVQAITDSRQFSVDLLGVLSAGITAFLYVNSAVRLDRRERLAEPAPVVVAPGLSTAAGVQVPGPTTRILVAESKPSAAGSGAETALLRPSPDGRRIEVLLGGTRIGELSGLAPAHRDALAAVGAPLVVRLLRTGDLLWAEVPVPAALDA